MNIECVVDARNAVGESPVWDAQDRCLYWVDIPEGIVFRLDPASGTVTRFEIGEPVGSLAIRATGGLVLATRSGFHGFVPETGAKRPIVDPADRPPATRFNDGATDGRGRFWAGTVTTAKPAEAVGAFYRLGTERACWRWRDGYFTTNGLAFAPDGRRFYFSDSNARVRTIWVADYDPDDGVPGEPTPLFDTRTIAGRPDGAAVDADGCYWFAGVGGWQLVRLTPAGVIDRIIELPIEKPSKPAFGGADLDVIYVTSISAGLTPGTEASQPHAGGIFALTGHGYRGVPQTPYGG